MRGQTGLEYLLMIAGGVLLSAVVMAVASNNLNLAAGSVNSSEYSAHIQNYLSTGNGANDGDWVVTGEDQFSGVPGNVGIGTTSPDAKLEVNGKILMDDATVSSDSAVTVATKGYVDGLQSVLVNASSVNSSQVQLRVNGTCSVGSYVTAVAADGSVTCGFASSSWNSSGNNQYSTNTGNVGINTSSPGATLDVNGKVIMRNETASTDSSNTLVTKGYLSSYTSPVVKVLTGVNPVCVNSDTLMRCNTASPCVWYDADYSLGSWSKIMCGQKLAYSTTDVFLPYSMHTKVQCAATVYAGIAGVPVEISPGVFICKFNASSCSSVPAPSNTAVWTQYQSWTTTVASGTSVWSGCGCSTSSHAVLSNIAPESCSISGTIVSNWAGSSYCGTCAPVSDYGCGKTYSCATCYTSSTTASVSQVGCY